MEFTRQCNFVFDSLQWIRRRENAQPAGMIEKIVHDRQSELKVRRLAKRAVRLPRLPI